MTTSSENFEQSISELETRQQQITEARQRATELSEKLAADYAAALVDQDSASASSIRAQLREVETDIAAADAALPEIVHRLVALRHRAREAALVGAKRENVAAREEYLARLGEADSHAMAVLREQLQPRYAELRERQEIATHAERQERALTGENLNREFGWMRAANQTYPGALLRMLTIEHLVLTGRPMELQQPLRQTERARPSGAAGIREQQLDAAIKRMGG